jgi:hypothetical protein
MKLLFYLIVKLKLNRNSITILQGQFLMAENSKIYEENYVEYMVQSKWVDRYSNQSDIHAS